MKPMKQASATLKDVAKVAGVSHQTVARVVRKSPKVAEKTRIKVEKAIADSGYLPNRMAQQLARRKSLTLGFVSIDISLHAISKIAEGIRKEAAKQGFTLSISTMNELNPDACNQAIDELLGQQVDGLIINTSVTHTMIKQILERGNLPPCIFIDFDKTSEALQVSHDQVGGASLAAQHLIDLGHTKIALINGAEDTCVAHWRETGWLNTLENAGLKPVHTIHGKWNARSGYQATIDLLDAGHDFTALLVANDEMCLGVLRALNERHIKVPEDISVVGFDNHEDSEFYNPPLTTVAQDCLELGEKSVSLLMQQMKEQAPEQAQVLLPTHLVQRQSTAPVKS
ncbi:LacI family DNA-binding transcriptional regulator [Agarivorans albus]